MLREHGCEAAQSRRSLLCVSRCPLAAVRAALRGEGRNFHPRSECRRKESPSGKIWPARAGRSFLPGKWTCRNQRPGFPAQAEQRRLRGIEPRHGAREAGDNVTLHRVWLAREGGSIVQRYITRLVRKHQRAKSPNFNGSRCARRRGHAKCPQSVQTPHPLGAAQGPRWPSGKAYR
jgi:hypothetical protein